MIHIEKAENITAGDIWGTSDPYVTIKSASGLVNTSTIYRTLAPVWNENLEILIKDKETEVLTLELYDHDLVNVDKIIGKAVITVNAIDDGDKVIDLRAVGSDRPAGRLYLSTYYVPFVVDKDDTHVSQQYDTGTDYLDDDANGEHSPVTPMSMSSNSKRGPLGSMSLDTLSVDMLSSPGKASTIEGGVTIGLLEVSKMKCKNIKVDLNKGLVLKRPKKLTPYLIISVKNSKTGVTTFSKDTRPAQKGFVNPAFDESFPIIIRDPENDVLEVRVVSGRKKLLQDELFLGKVTIPINELSQTLDENNIVIEREYLLYDGILMNEQRFFSCKLAWRTATTRL